jgi:hypothetical protein
LLKKSREIVKRLPPSHLIHSLCFSMFLTSFSVGAIPQKKKEGTLIPQSSPISYILSKERSGGKGPFPKRKMFLDRVYIILAK